MVAILAVLVWVYADQITTDSITEPVGLQVRAPAGSELILRVQEPQNESFQVTFSGPRAQLEDLRKDLVAGRVDLVYSVDPAEAQGSQLIKDAREIFSRMIRKQYGAIRVVATEPEALHVGIDRYVTVQLPVKVDTGTIRTSKANVKPANVTVKVPESLLKSLPLEQRSSVTVSIEDELKERLENHITEVNEEFSIEPFLGGHTISPDPSRVRVQLTIEELYETRQLEFSRVFVLMPPELQSDYRVEIREQNISALFRGPKEVIDELKSTDVIPFIPIESDDVARALGKPFPRPVQFIINKQGVEVDATNMPQAPKVDFSLVEIGAAPAAPGP